MRTLLTKRGGSLHYAVRLTVLLAAGAAVLAACGGGAHHSPEAAATTTTSVPAATTTPATTVPTAVPTTPATTAEPATATTAPPPTAAATTTTTTPAPPATPAASRFPSVINQAMEALQPPPSGMEAPDTLPHTSAAVSAQADKTLDGAYSVTLIATPSPLPVNSPDLGTEAANPSSDLGTFSTTPVDVASSAATYLQGAVTTCAGPKQPLSLTATAATTCETAEGPAVDWSVGAWRIQVVDEGGTSPPAGQAASIASWLASHSLPSATEGAMEVTAQAGASTSSSVTWFSGHDVYEVSSPGRPLATLALASSMRPWPGG